MNNQNMENKFVQPLLKAGLLVIGDSDERLADIENSITDLEKKLKDEQSLLPSYTLVALDPDIGSTEPALEAVEVIVTDHWKALRSKFPERPVPILRAVILHSLYNVGILDPKIARIIFLTATNFYPYAKLGREQQIVATILSELGEKAEEHAAAEWSLADDVPILKIPTLKIEPAKLTSIELDQEGLRQTLYNNTISSIANIRVAQDQWAATFSSAAAEAIVGVVKVAMNGVSEGLDMTPITSAINKLFSEFKTNLDQTLKTSFESMRAVERRTNLLWWKESMYSSSLKDSYRNVNDTARSVIMARDLYMGLPDIVPLSVNFLLRDTLFQLNQATDEKLSFFDLLTELSKPENKELLKPCFDDYEVQEGRMSITNLIGLLVHGKVEASSLKNYTGVDPTDQLSLSDLAVMVFCDWMAVHLIPKKK